LLLSKKHSDPLSEEKRQRVICDLICQGVRENLGFFTEKIRYCGDFYKYDCCYDHNNTPCSFLEGIAGVACYRKDDRNVEKVEMKKERRPSIGKLFFGRRSVTSSSSSSDFTQGNTTSKGKMGRRSSVDCRSISPRGSSSSSYQHDTTQETEDKIYLLLVWDVSYLGRAKEMCARFEAIIPVRIPLRIIVFNWNNVDIDFAEFDMEGCNVVSASQCERSIPFDISHIPSWTDYQERKISPRQ